MLNTNTPEIKFALHAVRQASELVQQVQAEMISPALTKDDRSPVTVADFAAQALVGYLLDQHFPNDPMVGEEDSAVLQTPEEKDTLARITDFVSRFTEGATPETVCNWIDRGSAESAPRFWTLDPIDGTKGFLRGDQYAVALALVENGKVQIGALGCPQLPFPAGSTLAGVLREGAGGEGGSIYIAARGQGAWAAFLNGSNTDFTQIHVSTQADPTQARLMRSFESGHTNVTKMDVFAEALGVQAQAVRMDSQAKYAVLASGGGEIYLRMLSKSRPDYREKIWDQAAGSIITEEAGGRVTDLHGQELNFGLGRTLANTRGICATNGILHEQALAALKEIAA
ncbi:MAG: 3'(2'),5'-bisphosphate nucleotidase [Chloroflexi bacterium]|jgi:3'(2'), 5'-bisphosphate nucleotidase|nr:3'(2'),5'-bisphosphate nucleotidase [Chloroflexota bacterium]